MSLIGRIAKRVRAVGARGRLEREMQDEMLVHIEEAAARFQARGMNARDAMLAARREFGNVGVLQEEARDARGARWIESIGGDLRYALRQFGRAPIITATIICTLTLGIGVAAAGFTTLNGFLSRPAPGVPDDPSLVTIRGIRIDDGRRNARGLSYPELMDYARLPQFSAVAGRTTMSAAVEVEGQNAESILTEFVTPNFFRTLGIPITTGTGFVQPGGDGPGPLELTAILTRIYAVEKFGTAEAAVGKDIKVNGVVVRVIGVAPPRFTSPDAQGSKRTIWLPLSAWQIVGKADADAFSNRSEGNFYTVARLASGTSIPQVTAAVEVISARAAAAEPVRSSRRPVSYTADVVHLRGDVRVKADRSEDIQMITMVSVLVFLVLLVCTTTVSSLLVGGALTRRHEMAVRLALGASRRRIMRQLMTETAILATVAAVAGFALYLAISREIRDGISDLDVDPTWHTAVATILFAAVATILCGLSPALHATRDGVSGVLKDSSTTSTVKSRLQRVFVVAQIALAQPLLVALAMMIAVVTREAGHYSNGALGEHVISAVFDTYSPAARAAAKAGHSVHAVMDRVSALPGVTHVIPQSNGYAIFKFETIPTEGAARRLNIRSHDVPPGYFAAMDVPIMRGRDFVPADSASKVIPIVIGSDFAQEVFGDADPLGKRLAQLGWDTGTKRGEAEVIGVVAVKDAGNSEYGSGLRVFTLLSGSRPGALLIRTKGPAEPMMATIHAIAREEAPLMPVIEMKTMAQIEAIKRSEVVEATSASAVGGILTLLLSSIGLYAVVALAVAQRRKEIGVRVSVGATPGQVVAMFFRGGLRVCLIGLAIGLPLSAAVMKLLSTMMGIPRTNMTAIATLVALAVVVVASLASWLPARRAAGVDPLIALRDG